MKRVQCLVCYSFMNQTPERICSEECRKIQNEKNQRYVESALYEKQAKKDQVLKKKKKQQEFVDKRNRYRAREKAKRRGRLNKKISSQAKQIRALKQFKRPNGFYETREWQELRYRAIREYGRKCACCQTTEGEMHVDHIKPRSKFPELQLDFKNLQILCRACNLGKSNLDSTDWREKP